MKPTLAVAAALVVTLAAVTVVQPAAYASAGHEATISADHHTEARPAGHSWVFTAQNATGEELTFWMPAEVRSVAALPPLRVATGPK